MDISIIIPVYNTNIGDFEKCIKSILNQTFENFEIIVVDDGSKNEIAAYIDDFSRKDSRIVVYHRENKGVSAARNFGISKAQGNYVMFADADDEFTPWALRSAMEAAKETQANVLIGRILQTERGNNFECEYKTSNSQKIIHLNTTKLLDEFEKHVFVKNCNTWGRNNEGWMFNGEGCWAHLVDIDTARSNLFEEGLSIGEDTLWAIRLLENRNNMKFCLVDAYWYYYYQNEYSVMNTYSKNIESSITKAVSLLSPLMEKKNCDVQDAYGKWLFIKLKQIVYRYYLANECEMSLVQKIFSIRNLIATDIWKKALSISEKFKKNEKIKLFLYRSGLIIVLYNLKK